ncbi:hypothetical protein [Antarctobacter jejuensis]|uniref:hypothetical protein n=1 Tax=Antarctobacter jejuensis TaxID=1439938 RepID=UPI003FD3EB92
MGRGIKAVENSIVGLEGPPTDRHQFDSGLNFMFLAAFPLLLWVFEDSFAAIATAVALGWVLSLALRLISVGQQIHHNYDRADVARAPKVPRKLIGSLLIGAVVLVLAGHKFDNLTLPALAGGLAILLSIGAFGLDPRHDKGTEKARERAILAMAEDAMAELADRVAALDDAELTLRVEAARNQVLRPMRRSVDDLTTMSRVARPVSKVTELLTVEVSRLETAWQGDGHVFARRRFLAKLEVLSESFEMLARQCGIRGARDAFERQADLLLDRMPRESAA